MIVNEYVDYINNINKASPYPKGGSTGMYVCDLVLKSKSISSTALKLFLVMACDINEYGQTRTSREEYAKVLGIKHSHARMSRLFAELIEEEMIAMFGKYITVNPYLVMPTIKSPKMKATVQEAWRDIIMYDATHV